MAVCVGAFALGALGVALGDDAVVLAGIGFTVGMIAFWVAAAWAIAILLRDATKDG